eukprot:g8646.t1
MRRRKSPCVSNLLLPRDNILLKSSNSTSMQMQFAVDPNGWVFATESQEFKKWAMALVFVSRSDSLRLFLRY